MPLVRNDAVENVGTLVLRHDIAGLQRQVSYLRPECADYAVIAAPTRLLPSRPRPGGIRDSTGIGYPSSISLRLASRPGSEVVDGGPLGVGLGSRPLSIVRVDGSPGDEIGPPGSSHHRRSPTREHITMAEHAPPWPKQGPASYFRPSRRSTGARSRSGSRSSRTAASASTWPSWDT